MVEKHILDTHEYAEQERMANDILTNYKGRPISIFKTTRAGATVSLVKNAIMQNKKVFIVVPTIAIADKTINDKVVELLPKTRNPKIMRIKQNKEMCLYVNQKLNKMKNTHAINSYPKCQKCALDGCEFKKILETHCDVLCITYTKLRFIMNSANQDYKKLMKKLSGFDVIIFDEFTIGTSIGLQFIGIRRIKKISQVLEKVLGDLEGKEKSYVRYMMRFCTQEIFDVDNTKFHKNKKTAMQVENKLPPKNMIKSDFLDFLLDKFFGKYLGDMQKLCFFMNCKRFVLRPHKKAVVVEPVIENGLDYLKKFSDTVSLRNKVFVVTDARMPDFFDLREIFGVKGTIYFWGDPKKTESRQLIISGTNRFLPMDFLDPEDKDGHKKTLKKLLSSDYFAFNKAIVVAVDKDMIKNKHGTKALIKNSKNEKNFMLTWYRSVVERGIELPEGYRDMVCIGLSFLPSSAYISDTIGIASSSVVKASFGKIQEHGIHKIYRKNFERSSYANMKGRIKDPRGVEKSVVIAFGTNIKTIRKFMTHDDPKYQKFLERMPQAIIVSPLANGELAETAPIMAFMWKGFDWETPETDLPILSRVVYLVNSKKSISTHEVLHNLSKKKQNKFKKHIIPTIDKNTKILEQFGIGVKKPRGGGRRLVLLKSFKYNFS